MSPRLRTDWKLYLAIVLMTIFGLVMVYSASSVVAEIVYRKETWEFAAKQIGFALGGLVLMLLLKYVDYRRWRHPIWVFFPLSIVVVLLVVVIFVDHTAHRWFRIVGFQLQPSEIAKPVLVLFLAYFVARREADINSRHTLGPASIVVAGLAGLIGYADLGTAAVILAPAVVIFYVAGIERRYFYVSILLAVLLSLGAVYQKPYRILRVTSYFGLTEEAIHSDPKWRWLDTKIAESKATRDADHQPRQAKIAVGSGGLTGVGLGESNQKLGFLPEAHTDFIFGVVCEELGLIGATLVLAGYLLIFWRGLRLYWLAPDVFGRYLALGAVSLVTAQALFNMSVVLSMAPTKGIPLPLISYGGSALLTTMVTLGFLLSVSDQAIEPA
jgi:cell division protein FtsW